MRDPMLPLEAVARTGGVLVDRPRSAVVHIALPTRPLTATGRLRNGDQPICKQPTRRCRRARFDGRPLCLHCATLVLVTTTSLYPDELTEPRLRATIKNARSAAELASAVRLLCYTPGPLTSSLSGVVRDQRRDLGLEVRGPLMPLPPQRRGDRKRAAWQRELGS